LPGLICIWDGARFVCVMLAGGVPVSAKMAR